MRIVVRLSMTSAAFSHLFRTGFRTRIRVHKRSGGRSPKLPTKGPPVILGRGPPNGGPSSPEGRAFAARIGSRSPGMNRSGSTDPTDIPRASYSSRRMRPRTGRLARRQTKPIALGSGCQLPSRNLSASGLVRDGIRHCFDLAIPSFALHHNQRRMIRSSLGENPMLRWFSPRVIPLGKSFLRAN
jgi:hypothetical protein